MEWMEWMEWMSADDTIETGLQFNPRHITVDGSIADQPIYQD
jgi:hypothetical protein